MNELMSDSDLCTSQNRHSATSSKFGSLKFSMLIIRGKPRHFIISVKERSSRKLISLFYFDAAQKPSTPSRRVQNMRTNMQGSLDKGCHKDKDFKMSILVRMGIT